MVMPKTKLGKWSVGLLVAFILLIVMFSMLGIDGEKGGVDFANLLTLSCALAGLVVGLMAIIKQRERAVLVFIAVVIDFLVVTGFIGAELFFPLLNN